MPDPPVYGGIIDVYYKIKSLTEAGARVTLHTFMYGDAQPSPQLEEWCDKVYYYPRATGVGSLMSTLPYIVKSRASDLLVENLAKTDSPIIFEGHHTTWALGHPALRDRLKIVRAHNVEQDYYRQIAGATRSLSKKLFYLSEAAKLSHDERRLGLADAIFPIAPEDAAHFRQTLPKVDTLYVPCFVREVPDIPRGEAHGPLLLYHGNLSVEENVKAANYIIDKVVPLLPAEVRVVIAGLNPSPRIHGSERIEIVASPPQPVMEQLMAEATVIALPTFQDTGIKLKLLNSLLGSRAHCVVNSPMLSDAWLGRHCIVADTPADMAREISAHCHSQVSDADFRRRFSEIRGRYGNAHNARLILDYLAAHSR